MDRQPWAQSPTWFPGTPREMRNARAAERVAQANQLESYRASSSHLDLAPLPSIDRCASPSHPDRARPGRHDRSSHYARDDSRDVLYDLTSFDDVPIVYAEDTPPQSTPSEPALRRSSSVAQSSSSWRRSPPPRSRRRRSPSPRSRSHLGRNHGGSDSHAPRSQSSQPQRSPPSHSTSSRPEQRPDTRVDLSNTRRPEVVNTAADQPHLPSAADRVPARQPGDNEYHKPSGMMVWRSLNGDIWSSPSSNVTAWPSRVPPTGPLRYDYSDEWNDAVKPDSILDPFMTNPGLPGWWSPAQPHMAFYPRYPLEKESDDNVLKSLAHVTSDDDAIEQLEDGSWAPRQSQAWVDLGIMLGMIYGVLCLAHASDARFPVRQWRTLTPGWWKMNTWTKDKNIMAQVARFQLFHLVTFSASVSYLCAIARFKSGEADGWYRTLQQFGLNNSVRRWCDRLRHTWIPLMQDVKRAGTFFDAQDIAWPDLLQLHLDSDVSVFIYWGREAKKIPHIRKGIIPDHFRPTPMQVHTAPPPPDIKTVQRLRPLNRHDTATSASSGDKRRRDDLSAQPGKPANPLPDLTHFRDHFRRAYAHYLRHEKDPAVQEHRQRASRWEVAKKDKGCLWEHIEETGAVRCEPKLPVSGERMKELVESEELTWLLRYDPTSRHWHRFPEGTFAAPQPVINRGVDMDSRYSRQNANEFMRERGPVLTKEDWEHLIGLQDFVVDELRAQQYAPVSHILQSILPTLEEGIAEVVDAADMSDLQSLIAARSASVEQVTEEEIPIADSTSGPLIVGGNFFAQVPVRFDTEVPLKPDDWVQDAACGPHERIRVTSIQTALNRAGFVRRGDDEHAVLIRSPLTLPKPPKLVPVLQYSLAILGAWPGWFGAKADDSQWMAYEAELGIRLGISTSLLNSIADFTARLTFAGIDLGRGKMNKVQPQPPRQPPPFHLPAIRTWMYDPASAEEAFSTIAKTNIWRVENVVRTVLGPKDGRTEAKEADVEGWLLARADGHHGRGVILYDACVVVQIMLDPSFEAGDDIITYCAQSTICFNETTFARVAPETVHSADQLSARRAAALAFRSSHVLGYRPADHVVGGTDFVDYEEARRQLFQNLMIVLAAIKAGGIIARLALEHVAPDVVLQGPHADTLELDLGARIRQTLGDQMVDFTDDELTPELELFIVGGYYEQVGQLPSDFDHVRTFFPRNKIWRTHMPGPGWDFDKESIYQHYRSMNLNPPRDDKSSFGPCSNNGWTQRLKRRADHRRASTAIEHYAKQFLQSRSKHKYFR